MIRIIPTGTETAPVVKIAGNLEAGHVGELEEQCGAFEARVAFDLAELRSADAAAVCWLRGRMERGDEITGATPYVRLLLERAIGSGQRNEGGRRIEAGRDGNQ